MAIVYAAQVDGKYAAGDYGAVDSASKAKTWSWVSFGIGIVVTVLWFFIGFFAELFANPNPISTIIDFRHFSCLFHFVIA